MKKLSKGFSDCPEHDISPEHAWQEQSTSMLIEIAQAKVEDPDLSQDEINELHKNFSNTDEMKCFCSAHTVHGIFFWKFFTLKWKEYDPSGEDTNNYCLIWVWEAILDMIFKTVSATSMIVLNAIIAQLFARLSKFKKRHTTISE